MSPLPPPSVVGPAPRRRWADETADVFLLCSTSRGKLHSCIWPDGHLPYLTVPLTRDSHLTNLTIRSHGVRPGEATPPPAAGRPPLRRPPIRGERLSPLPTAMIRPQQPRPFPQRG